MGTAGWRELRPGTAGEVLLCVDFGQGRPEAGFEDLAALLPAGGPVWESDFGGAAPCGAAAAQLDRWLDLVGAADLRVGGVLGWCAGGTLACALSDAATERGLGRPAAVLLDPEVVNHRTLYWQFVWAAEAMADQLIAGRLDAARAFAGWVTGGGRDLAAMAAELSGHYGELVGEVCGVLELDEEVADDFQARFDDYLCYLLTASQVPFGCRHQQPVVLTSRAYEPPPVPGARHREFPVPHDRFLTTAEVAGAVLEALAAPAGEGP